jgi:hypothetical protein
MKDLKERIVGKNKISFRCMVAWPHTAKSHFWVKGPAFDKNHQFFGPQGTHKEFGNFIFLYNTLGIFALNQFEGP